MEALGFILMAVGVFIMISGLIKAGFTKDEQKGLFVMFIGLGVVMLSPLWHDVFFLIATQGQVTLESSNYNYYVRGVMIILGLGLITQMYINIQKYSNRN